MSEQGRERAYRIAAVLVWLMFGPMALAIAAFGQAGSTTTEARAGMDSEAKGVTMRAAGTFDVKVTPLPARAGEAEGVSGHMSLEKEFHGDLEGSSRGEMLTAGSPAKGSAGYVAMERVTGTLKGRTGSFVLQHSGTMSRGALQLSVTVVPDSGTDGLAGLGGKMTIEVLEGKHRYTFEYTIDEAHGTS